MVLMKSLDTVSSIRAPIIWILSLVDSDNSQDYFCVSEPTWMLMS